MKPTTTNAHLLEQKIEPVAKFFGEAEPRVRGLTVPPSLSKVHGQYLEAMDEAFDSPAV
jgi:hypothetical protein